MSRERYRLGPGEGYRGIPAPPPRPAGETTRAAALSALRDLIAHRGPRCTCTHGSHVHRHRDPSAAHCGIRDCGCTAYRKASP